MPDIEQLLCVQAPPARVFRGISTPEGLSTWWTKSASGTPGEGEEYELSFGGNIIWRAVVTHCIPEERFDLEMTEAVEDWLGTRVGFQLSGKGEGTQLRFQHLGWPSANDHYYQSCHGWALYLRILRRNIEYGEEVDYGDRLA